MTLQKSGIGGFVENLAKDFEHDSGCVGEAVHALSSVRRVITKGASFTGVTSAPRRIEIHWRTDSMRTSATMTTRMAVTAASSRLFRIRRPVALVAGAEASACAWARKPIRGLESKIFCHDAVKVTATNHARGTSVTAAYLAR